MHPWTLVSPASRGIGFELARLLLKNTSLPVVATARTHPERVRDALLNDSSVDPERLHVLQVDVTQEPSIARAAQQCCDQFEGGPLRLAYCVPGILHPEKAPTQVNADDALQTFRVNALGPLLLSKHFAPLLPRKSLSLPPLKGVPDYAVLGLMSARVGSTSDNALGGWYSYRASKAAVNSIAKSVDIYLSQRCGDNAMCMSMHPGTVRTGLSQAFWGSTPSEKLFSAPFAAEKLHQVVRTVGLRGRGRCWDWQGQEILP